MKRRACLCAAAAALAGCATVVPPASPLAGAPGAAWSGRLSLQVASEPPQSLTAAFELQGSADAGELTLSTPLGSTLAQLTWSAGRARMVTPQGTREFSSVDALVAEITGTPVPVRGLFEWLGGREASIDGWQADLSRHAEGRLQARRLSPVPVADLRLVFERS